MTLPDEFHEKKMRLDGKTPGRDLVPFANALEVNQDMSAEGAYKAGVLAALHALGFRMAEMCADRTFSDETNDRVLDHFVEIRRQMMES